MALSREAAVDQRKLKWHEDVKKYKEELMRIKPVEHATDGKIQRWHHWYNVLSGLDLRISTHTMRDAEGYLAIVSSFRGLDHYIGEQKKTLPAAFSMFKVAVSHDKNTSTEKMTQNKFGRQNA